MKKILLVEDNRLLAGKIYEQLAGTYEVSLCFTEKELYTKLHNNHYDLIILDRKLDNFDTLESISYIRDTWNETKIICVSQLNSIQDRVLGLVEGCDDYISKPFSFSELEIKIKKLLSFNRIGLSDCIEVGQILFYPQKYQLIVDGVRYRLKKKEAMIFECLSKHKNHIVSRETLFTNVWTHNHIPSDITLDVYIRRLRVKLHTHATMLKTIRGQGYMLTCEVVS